MYLKLWWTKIWAHLCDLSDKKGEKEKRRRGKEEKRRKEIPNLSNIQDSFMANVRPMVYRAGKIKTSTGAAFLLGGERTRHLDFTELNLPAMTN